MANVSDAFGKLTIKKEGSEMSLQLLKKVFQEIGDLDIYDDELEFDVPLSFATTGR